MKTEILELVDSHCHIHDSSFATKFAQSSAELISDAKSAGVSKLICVGTDVKSSLEAVSFASKNNGCYASVGLHPHEASKYDQQRLIADFKCLSDLTSEKPGKLVAIGECGLDYFYHSDKESHIKQEILFRQHIELALSLKVPMIFHIRDAFTDFFRILDEYPSVDGVVHSFSAHIEELEGCLNRGLYIGLNGIMTFTTDQKQLEAAKNVPIRKLLLETDSPYLTPVPFRGKVNTPKHVTYITKFLSELRNESPALLAKQTSQNAKNLFNL